MSTAELPIAKKAVQTAAIPKKQIDWIPLLLTPVLALAALPFISPSTWLTLTIAGLAMGMIIFVIASGLTLIFGLMDVLNFGHGLFIALGGYVAYSVLGVLSGWVAADSMLLNIGAIMVAIVAAMVVSGLVGWVFERVLVRRVYGLHLMQILITMGGMVVGEELIKVIWGAAQMPMAVPTTLLGSGEFLGVPFEKYRIFAVVIGLIVFAIMMLVLNRTKLGLLIRAGVQDAEMVESLGYRIKSLFVGVFVTGTALAGLGGVLWGLYQQGLTPQMGAGVNVLIFIVIIIGGLGSTGGSFIGAMLVGLLANYTGYLTPKVALVSNILLMVAILVWRPNGIYKVTNR
ncbi:branched-chain amino acid ABC transporter permease [Noviherbaspirillum sedimenti]|uniref:Branched-chain amino acid ABC transporter permease n=1 Tax=Noviherbaspirillum sedimenti TaxID=2320865 RepID=A0A3A3G2U1_9BURK|nr:branched-chain amino acid ABC transporter permease [Noviherbaspirillum sedimenti]RJG02787.1 branched-chain amino acid ABC transporter permease [Noviherbaspirillum sedimenti]